MLLASISFTVLRYIRKVHYSITTLLFGFWGSIEMFILALAFQVLKVPSGYKEWSLILGLAFLTFLGQCAIILAMKAEQAGPVALVRTCDVGQFNANSNYCNKPGPDKMYNKISGYICFHVANHHSQLSS